MVLFNVCRGVKSNLPSVKHDGWVYFCEDTGDIYIDWKDDSGALHRTQSSAASTTSLKYKDGNEYVELDGSVIAESMNDIKLHIDDTSMHIPSGGSVGMVLMRSADGGVAWNFEGGLVYNNATTTTDGLMSSDDKAKVDSVSHNAGAIIPSATEPSVWTTKDLWIEIIE